MKQLFTTVILAIFLVACAPQQQSPQISVLEKVKQQQIANAKSDFERYCYETNGEWMKMQPMRNGKEIENRDECYGCMPDEGNHICDEQEYRDFVSGRI